jgi:hypothetical protein
MLRWRSYSAGSKEISVGSKAGMRQDDAQCQTRSGSCKTGIYDSTVVMCICCVFGVCAIATGVCVEGGRFSLRRGTSQERGTESYIAPPMGEALVS